ncbi:hypothetical protein JAAARDRAFT_652302 [Jaapia argillacea MUCL 33604]|uniref:Major facilitator superfamily (MFS) profile domain-containing protein n=1 Tax=Jaapia argillacea MUCL 33604 TaxID=933084 RepID=A0A067PW98_9AGAM|nr:hypothetical protein JAAARDRAFT_652302 [Jaapia argillacea MUCL 33604]
MASLPKVETSIAQPRGASPSGDKDDMDGATIRSPSVDKTGGCSSPASTIGVTPSFPEGLTDQTNFLPARRVITVYVGLSIALACSFLEQTIVATALPRISSDLHGGRESSWVATAYLLTSLALTPLYGRWSDIFGRKIVLIVALGIFWIFSLACALSQTMLQLIIFRALQGIGGGAIITMVLIIVSDIVSLRERGKYQGITEGIAAISNGIGPVLGGVFSQYTTWRWAFWLNLPLAGLAIGVTIWLLPLKRVRGDMKSKLMKIDYVGSALTIISSALLLIGLTWGGVTYPWLSAAVLVPLLLGGVVLVAFLVWEAKWAVIPIIPIHIFKYKTVVGVYITMVMNGMAFFAVLFYIPQFLQLVRGTSAMTSSILLLPFLAPIPFIVFVLGQITARTGIYRPMIIVGYALWTVAQGLMTTIDEHTSNSSIAGFVALAGLSAGMTFQTSLIACQAAVPRHEMAVVTGVRMFLKIFGSTITLAISSSIINNTLKTALYALDLTAAQIDVILNDPTTINTSEFSLGPDAKQMIVAGYTKGFRGVFYTTVAYTAVAFIASVLLIGHHELNRDDDAVLKQAGKERFKSKKVAKSLSDSVDPDVEKGESVPDPEKDEEDVLQDVAVLPSRQ